MSDLRALTPEHDIHRRYASDESLPLGTESDTRPRAERASTGTPGLPLTQSTPMGVESSRGLRPRWLTPELFPFESRFADVGGARIHYVDEGSGPVLLFLHGAPNWSFFY